MTAGDAACTGKPCSNGGACTPVGDSFLCKCQKGFGGKQCEEPHMCEFKPCNNGATCLETNDSYRCTCAFGYSGPKCEVKLTCESGPCHNGGTCHALKGLAITCTCHEGFTGSLCQEPLGTLAGVKQVCGDTICDTNERCDMTETKMTTKYKCVCRPGANCKHAYGHGGLNLDYRATLGLLGVCSASVVIVILIFTLCGTLYNMK
ncbi:hypothetical protein LSAT2_025353 [Lamellibrachia satsuma]|nr:hypothetical protein LSAT2_025353 [Lamellibrachia satsuma]